MWRLLFTDPKVNINHCFLWFAFFNLKEFVPLQIPSEEKCGQRHHSYAARHDRLQQRGHISQYRRFTTNLSSLFFASLQVFAVMDCCEKVTLGLGRFAEPKDDLHHSTRVKVIFSSSSLLEYNLIFLPCQGFTPRPLLSCTMMTPQTLH